MTDGIWAIIFTAIAVMGLVLSVVLYPFRRGGNGMGIYPTNRWPSIPGDRRRP